MTITIDKFKDKLCMVSFVDGGREYHQKGIIKNIDERFIFLETFENYYAINMKDVVKVKAAIPVEGGE